jgi:hypothetical protein
MRRVEAAATDLPAESLPAALNEEAYEWDAELF